MERWCSAQRRERQLLVFVWDPKELSVGAKNSQEVSEEDEGKAGNVQEAGEGGRELSRVALPSVKAGLSITSRSESKWRPACPGVLLASSV